MNRIYRWRFCLFVCLLCTLSCSNSTLAEDVGAVRAISPDDLQRLRKHWYTDGYWYFFAKGNRQDRPTSAYIKKDRSDVILESSRSSIWINARRLPTKDDLKKRSESGYYKYFDAYPPQVLCDQVTVGEESYSNAHSRDLLGSQIVIRDRNKNKITSFAVFIKYKTPIVLRGYVRDDHDDDTKPLRVPVESGANLVAVFEDCTFFAKLADGLIRFNADGTTQARLPPSMRLVYGDEILRLNEEFDKSFSFGLHREHFRNSLQSRLEFFYRRLFEDDKK